MRRLSLAILLLTICVTAPRAQEAITTNQRNTDLIQLAGMYAKNYAPYEWKRDVVGFDLYRLTPWLQRIHHSDDLDFQEALIEYVASLNDAHSFVSFPSNFTASLGFTVDIFDGKVLIDSVNRLQLPIAQYPFDVGDELVALDGQSVESLIASFRKYNFAANQRSTDRAAASLIPNRFQQIMPHAPEIGDSAFATVRLSSTGAVNSYMIPWVKTGIGIESQGPVPSPRRGNGRIFLPSDIDSPQVTAAAGTSPALFQVADLGIADNTLPSYMDPIRPLLNGSVAKLNYSIRGVGGRSPIYGLPAGFVVRLGTQPSHFFFSGTYIANGVRIGLIRVPSMSPPNAALALQQLDQETAFFNANTDVLIVDATRNPGGLISFAEAVSQRFIPTPFRTVGFEIRATATWVASFASRLTSAQLSGAPPEVIQNLRGAFNEVLSAYNEERGRSAPVSLNSTGSLTLTPVPNAYTKPLMTLVDDFTVSAGDMFAAIMQDNHRGPIFGVRTMGAGGTVVGFNCTAFTESLCRITVSLMNRGTVISSTEFPPVPYIENIGVRPDIVVDYMTRANLVSAGAPFVQAFTQTAVALAHTTPAQ
jgi:hypothetical protein